MEERKAQKEMRILRRTRFLINEFQYRILFLQVLYFFALILVFTAAIFVPLILELESGSLSFAEKHAVANQFLSLHSRIWPAVLVLFVLLSGHSVFVSHRIAGPLYRFRVVLDALKEGEISSPISIRKGDYLQQEADLINEVLESLRQNLEGLQEAQVQLSQAMTEYREELGQNLSAEEEERVRDLTERADELTDRLRYFKLAA